MKYSVLTYVFKNYEHLKEVPQEEEVEYICVTDDSTLNVKGWKIIIDDSLVNLNGEYASFYVRHHPFKYCTGNICLRVDASIKINKPLLSVFEEFDNTNYDICVMTNSRAFSILDELYCWKHIIPKDMFNNQLDLYKSIGVNVDEDGCIQSPISIVRNNDACNQCDSIAWDFIDKLSTNERTLRPSQVALTAALACLDKLNIMFVDERLIQSDIFQWYYHNYLYPRRSNFYIKHNKFFDKPIVIYDFKDVHYNNDFIRREVKDGKSIRYMLNFRRFITSR